MFKQAGTSRGHNQSHLDRMRVSHKAGPSEQARVLLVIGLGNGHFIDFQTHTHTHTELWALGFK